MDFCIHVHVGAIRHPYGEQENTNMKGQDSFSNVGTGEVLYQSRSSSLHQIHLAKHISGAFFKISALPALLPVQISWAPTIGTVRSWYHISRLCWYTQRCTPYGDVDARMHEKTAFFDARQRSFFHP